SAPSCLGWILPAQLQSEPPLGKHRVSLCVPACVKYKTQVQVPPRTSTVDAQRLNHWAMTAQDGTFRPVPWTAICTRHGRRVYHAHCPVAWPARRRGVRSWIPSH
ncbi:hypothetical protein BCR44DRAFT_1444160, partial [Catenaria anguillulae PL171]